MNLQAVTHGHTLVCGCRFAVIIVLDKFRSVNPLEVFLLEAHQNDTDIFYGQHNKGLSLGTKHNIPKQQSFGIIRQLCIKSLVLLSHLVEHPFSSLILQYREIRNAQFPKRAPNGRMLIYPKGCRALSGRRILVVPALVICLPFRHLQAVTHSRALACARRFAAIKVPSWET